MAGSTTTVCSRRWKDAAKSARSGQKTWSSDCDSAHLAFASAPALSRNAENRSGEHGFRSGRSRSRASLSPSGSDNIRAEPEFLTANQRSYLGSRLSLERGRTDPLFRSSLKSGGSRAAIPPALSNSGGCKHFPETARTVPV